MQQEIDLALVGDVRLCELVGGRQRDIHKEAERRSVALFAVDPDLASEQLHQLERDCQPEARAAIKPRGR